jgi:tRNA(Arg) A34 adenosine deaminase TadA
MAKIAVVLLSLALALTLFFTFAHGHAACAALENAAFTNGSQHCDCDYSELRNYPGNATELANDIYWIRMVHNYAVTNMARYPFGAALVDSRNNSLVTIGYNNFFTPDPFYSSIAVSHAETVVMTNASINIFPGSFNTTSGSRRVDPNWKYLVLYGNIETCPMCAQAAIWRGIRKMVFGARASLLQKQRCWTQPTLTAYEVVDHSASFAPFDFIRGPVDLDLEQEILLDFRNQCPTSTTTTTSAASRTNTPYESMMENVKALL